MSCRFSPFRLSSRHGSRGRGVGVLGRSGYPTRRPCSLKSTRCTQRQSTTRRCFPAALCRRGRHHACSRRMTGPTTGGRADDPPALKLARVSDRPTVCRKGLSAGVCKRSEQECAAILSCDNPAGREPNFTGADLFRYVLRRKPAAKVPIALLGRPVGPHNIVRPSPLDRMAPPSSQKGRKQRSCRPRRPGRAQRSPAEDMIECR